MTQEFINKWTSRATALMRSKRGMGMLGIWMTILVSSFVFGLIYIHLNHWMTTEFPSMIEHNDTLDAYNGAILPFWETLPWLFGLSMVVFGVFLGPTLFERGSYGG